MTFKTLSSLLENHTKLVEAPDDTGGMVGPKPHPVLSRAELVRFSDKMDQAFNKLEEIRSIFKHVPDATGPAHKLGHIGQKGGFDMSNFTAVNDMIDKLEDTINELHQSWGMQIQTDTGEFDEPEDEPADDEVETPDDPLEEPSKAKPPATK